MAVRLRRRGASPASSAFASSSCYLVLAAAPFPLGTLPWTEPIAELWSDLFVPPTVWMAEHLFGLGDLVVEFNGSGDRTLDYLLVLDILVLATLATIAWSLSQRRPDNHEQSAQARVIRNAFDVDQMTVDGQLLALGERSPLRWRTVSFRTKSMRIQFADRRVEVYQLSDETTIPMTLNLRRFGEPEGTTRGTLDLRADATGHIVEGSFEERRSGRTSCSSTRATHPS